MAAMYILLTEETSCGIYFVRHLEPQLVARDALGKWLASTRVCRERGTFSVPPPCADATSSEHCPKKMFDGKWSTC